MRYTLDLTQELTVMKYIWHLSRIAGQKTPLGTIEQARTKHKEQERCMLPNNSGLWFSFKARSVLELATT